MSVPVFMEAEDGADSVQLQLDTSSKAATLLSLSSSEKTVCSFLRAVNKAHRGLTILRPSKRLERAKFGNVAHALYFPSLGTAANLGSFPYWCLTGLNSSMRLGLSFLLRGLFHIQGLDVQAMSSEVVLLWHFT